MSSPSVLVVGAGISGLSCAFKLVKNGVSNVKVVEAKDKIGGRISTVRPDDKFFFEAGAQWIHGCVGNLIKEFVDANSIKAVIEKETSEYLFESKGGCCTDSQLVSELTEAEEFFTEILQAAEAKTDIQGHTNVMTYLKEKWSERYGNHAAANHLFKALLNLQNVVEGSSSMDEVDIAGYDTYNYCDGGDVSVTGGLDQIINLLASCLPHSSLMLSSLVVNIDWSGKSSRCGKVLVKVFHTPTRREKIYQVDYVVVTTPLGVLKANHRSLFTPLLPENKIFAIQSLGFGCVAKVVFRFDGDAFERFWQQRRRCDDEDRRKTPVYLHLLRDGETTAHELGHYSVLVTKCHTNQEYLMMVWLSGEAAATVEMWDEEKLKTDVAGDIRKFMPGLPRPSEARVTRWRCDPYTRGSYTFLAVGSSLRDLEAMAQPVGGERVRFAGEATHPRHFSTIHGAYDTGIREAGAILLHHEKSVGSP